MEVREVYVARLLSSPAEYGFTEVKFIHTPQVIVGQSPRLRCQFLCQQQRQSPLCPPFTPSVAETQAVLQEYRFGLLMRHEEPVHGREEHPGAWARFHAGVMTVEQEAFRRGYAKAFALGVGNCILGHLDDSVRPCDFGGKTRPTVEAVGINMPETLDVIGWSRFANREEEEPFQMFALILLE